MKNLLQIYILSGLPGSGKSTKAINIQADMGGPRECYIINRDSIRNCLGGSNPDNYYVPEREDFVTQIEKNMFYEAMDAGKHIISDNTNLNPKYTEWMKEAVEKYNSQGFINKASGADNEYEIVEVFVDTSLNDCIARDKARGDAGGRYVGKKVIRSMYYKYLSGTHKDPGIKIDPRINQKSIQSLPNSDTPRCIICDIDGTLALINGRSPYNGENCATDEMNYPVLRVLRQYMDTHEIILFSGRNGESEQQTKEWLEAFNVPYTQLVMREPGNSESDVTLKKRFFMEHIHKKKYVDFILDDRDSVVNMWREDLGLPCFQVYYGDF